MYGGEKVKNRNVTGARDAMLQRMVAAGWPERVGLNDKRKTCHNRLSLDGSTIHTFYTKGHGFFIYDPSLKLVTSGDSRDSALVAMVRAREDATGKDISRRGPIGACWPPGQRIDENGESQRFGSVDVHRSAEDASDSGQQALFAAE
jgi:hypothetical protein